MQPSSPRKAHIGARTAANARTRRARSGPLRATSFGMPEVLTKYPEVVLQVLKSQGAQCGPANKPKILTRCPPERFCSLSGGELCVYGTSEISQMTQLFERDAGRGFDVEQRQSEVDQLNGQLEAAQWNLDKTIVRAPAVRRDRPSVRGGRSSGRSSRAACSSRRRRSRSFSQAIGSPLHEL